MANLNVLAQLFSVGTAAWAVVAMLGVALFAAWPRIMERRNESKRDRAAIEGSQYERMDARMQRLEQREEECQRQLTDALKRIATLEGFQVGRGEGHNEAQMILSSERQADAKKAKPDG